MEADSSTDVNLKKVILAYLFEIIENYAKALDYWKDYVIVKHAEQEQIPFKVAIRILINSQSDKPLFFELLAKHLSWLAQGISSLTKALLLSSSYLVKSESTQSCLIQFMTDSSTSRTPKSTTRSWRTSTM